MRIMGLDVGSKTVGVAISDPLGFTAQGVEIIKIDEEAGEFGFDRLGQLVKEYKVDKFVVGLPKNMNNTLGERAARTEEFKAALERRTGIPVILWDERLSTAAAERVLIERGVRREHRKETVDQIAAALILQGYLDSLSVRNGNENG